MLRSAEGRLGVDDPVVTKQEPEPRGEDEWFSKWREVAVELDLALVEGRLQCGDALAAKDTAENLHWQKERSSRRDPVRVVRSKPASGNDAMDMGMVQQSLVPCMEHAEEADLRAQVTRVASNLQQGCGTSMEEQVVDQPFVL